MSFVRHLIREEDTFFIGRGLDYAFSLEGALSLRKSPISTQRRMLPVN